MKNPDEWDAQVRAAQASGDWVKLAQIYHHLGLCELTQNNEEAGAFLLVQAYVYALEAGIDLARDIHHILKKMGREE